MTIADNIAHKPLKLVCKKSLEVWRSKLEKAYDAVKRA